MKEEGISKRKSIHQHDNPSGSEEAPLVTDSKCKECLSWYSFDSKGNEKKLNEDEAHKRESSELPNNQFICSNCSSWSLNTVLEQLTDFYENNSRIVCGVAVLLALTALLYVFYLRKDIPRFELPPREDTEKWLDEAFDELEKIYKNQDEESWSSFASGIKSVARENPNKPAVFLMVFDNEAAGKTAECLAKEVSALATAYLMNSTNAPVMFHDFNTHSIRDKGELIPMFTDRVKSSGSMIISNLQDVRPTLAEAFHSFCDRYAPAVERAVYFFTLKVSGFQQHRAQRDAENELKNLWSNHMKENIFQPLLTRLTPNTLAVANDKTDC